MSLIDTLTAIIRANNVSTLYITDKTFRNGIIYNRVNRELSVHYPYPKEIVSRVISDTQFIRFIDSDIRIMTDKSVIDVFPIPAGMCKITVIYRDGTRAITEF